MTLNAERKESKREPERNRQVRLAGAGALDRRELPGEGRAVRCRHRASDAVTIDR